MLGFAGIPSLIQFVGFFFMPESPRYLCLQGKEDLALDVLTKIYGDPHRATEEVKSIKESFTQNKQKVTANGTANGHANGHANGNSNGYPKKNSYDSNNNGFTVIELHKTKESCPMQAEDQDLNYFGKLWAIMKDPATRHCLILGICLHIGQQFSGINSIMWVYLRCCQI